MKLYAEEDGSADVRSLRSIVCSLLARVEVPAALWEKQRAGSLSVIEAGSLTSDFELDWYGGLEHPRRFIVIDVSASLVQASAGVAAENGLRAYDAVQLASAEAARAADPGCDTFACFDSSLRDAAVRSGFALLPAGG